MAHFKLASGVVLGLFSLVGCAGSKDHGSTYEDGTGTAGAGGAGGGAAGNQAGASPDAGTISPAPGDAAADQATPTPGPDVIDVPSLCADAGACGLTITPEALVIPADGKATDVISVALYPFGTGETVELTIQGRGAWGSPGLKKMTVALDAMGKGAALFLSDAEGGTAIINAKRIGHQENASATVEMPVLADITVSPLYALMGVKSSGFQESNLLTFQVRASNQVPYPRGLKVEIQHKPLGRSTLGALPTCTTTDCVITDTGVTDEKGEVKINLISGKTAGTAIVSMTATAGGQTKVVTTSSPVVGAKASGKNVAVDCSPRNVPALLDTDCVYSRVDAPIECTATLGDRFGNKVGIKTDVTYASEAGLAGAPQITLAYPDPNIGRATGTIGTLGGRLPLDVPPLPGERSVQFAGCGNVERNPRDGVVTVIAMMKGEEGFVDENGDGDFNPGEPFVDIAEPYVDKNDNNTQDPGEDFLDLNNNERWDGPNGVWDVDTMLWVQTRILYSAGPARLVIGGQDYLSRIPLVSRQVPGGASAVVTSLQMKFDEVLDIGFFVSDANMNVLAPQALYSAIASTPVVNVLRPDPMAAARPEGFFYEQAYCDAAAPTVCGPQCPPSPTTKQCVVRAILSRFEYGVPGSIHIVAGQTAGGFNLITSSSVGANTSGSGGATLLMQVAGTVVAPPPPPP